ncbi:MAG TPA: uroporphyrinogen-III C-methyltransferase [Chryseolinea sp.]|nr:uroporphyrinogen-III C-methyltransferase [Chryseolinea sp.]HPH47472.1 uroporphyrinogen-III C-methyltransferase [Chryseolinea sp.]HPM30051.1 uroporphyrinogen-III C-methyltransferase [Chryseolinea sp.]
MIPAIFTSSKDPKLTLVGAGPGDPELITLKAIKAIEAADIVLYDALVSDEILKMIPKGVPTLSVGKRARQHSHSQDEINELIVEFAYLYGHVVRLKGGDPFVFGRGSEEIDFAELHGVQVQFVPGISSSLSVPASIGIPITARGVSESFWVVTGTTKNGDVSSDLVLAAQSSATIVILMGLHKIQEIMEQFEFFGKGEVPVAVIQNGTLPNQRSIVGTVKNIVALAKQEIIGAPAVIVVGEVVKYAKQLNSVILETIEN